MTFHLILIAHNLNNSIDSIAIEVRDCDKEQLRQVLEKIVSEPMIEPEKLAMLVQNKLVEKFDYYLDTELQAENFSSARLYTSMIQDRAGELLSELSSQD